MVLADRLYGWGAGKIILPRAATELHPDRLRRTGQISYHDKRGEAVYRWRSSSISRIFFDDYPWRQALIFGILCTIIIASIYLFNNTLPIDKDEQPTIPVEIFVALTKDEPQKVMSPEEPKPLEPSEVEQVEQAVVAEPVPEKPPKEIIAKPKEVKPDIYRKKQVRVSELPVPSVKKKRRFALRKAPESQKITTTAPPIKKQPKLEKITISPPAVRQRNYQGKNTSQISQISRASEVTGFVSKKNNKPTEDIVDTGRLERRYHSDIQNNQKSKAPQLKTTSDIIAFNRSEETAGLSLPGAHLADRRYGSEAKTLPPSTQTTSPSTDRQVSFQPQKYEKITGLKPQKGARPFTKKSPSPLSASKGAGAPISFSASRQQIELAGTTLPKSRQADGRYAFEKSNQFSSRAPQSTKPEFSFQSQNREEKPTLVPPVSAKLRAKQTRAAKKSSSSLANAHDFSDTITLDEIDPSELISLKEFTVCKDPEKEFRQKTHLAVRLHRPSRIEAEGVLFFIKYTESGYTIEIDIYNPHGRPFKTRCEVMQLAIDNIINRVN
jgi:hypothetical protein